MLPVMVKGLEEAVKLAPEMLDQGISTGSMFVHISVYIKTNT